MHEYPGYNDAISIACMIYNDVIEIIFVISKDNPNQESSNLTTNDLLLHIYI